MRLKLELNIHEDGVSINVHDQRGDLTVFFFKDSQGRFQWTTNLKEKEHLANLARILLLDDGIRKLMEVAEAQQDWA